MAASVSEWTRHGSRTESRACANVLPLSVTTHGARLTQPILSVLEWPQPPEARSGMAYTPTASLTATPRSNPVGVATDSAGFCAQTPAVSATAVGPARSMRSEVARKSFIPIRLRHPDKNGASPQQPDISSVTRKTTSYTQVFYTALGTMFGVLCGSI